MFFLISYLSLSIYLREFLKTRIDCNQNINLNYVRIHSSENTTGRLLSFEQLIHNISKKQKNLLNLKFILVI